MDTLENVQEVTFSKDSSKVFNPSEDNVEGRVYFRQGGIYVDKYQYSIVTPATETTNGVVKLKSTFDSDANGVIIAPTDSGVAATPQMVYNALASVKDYVDGVTAPDVYIEESQGSETSRRKLQNQIIFSEDFEATDENKIYLKWLEIV